MLREVAEAEVAATLAANAEPEWRGEQGWIFQGSILSFPPVWHSDAEARTIVWFCLALARPVTDVLSGAMFGAVVDELLKTQRAVRRLGGIL
jgi:hypothetical protein